MSHEKYQIQEKANYLNLLILKDELLYFSNLLRKSTKDIDDLIIKFRNTRQVLLTLYNVREAAKRVNLKSTPTYLHKTRKIRKKLDFIDHLRNKLIGHLEHSVLERAVQWHPWIFSSSIKDNEKLQVMGGLRAVIESSINSFLDDKDIQKVFKTEIDLAYPPNYKLFYDYIFQVIAESIDWISDSLFILSSTIKYYDSDDLLEVSAIAGQTDFNLKKESNFFL